MSNTRDWKHGQRIQVLVYGRSKIGKTFGAYTFPRPVVMDFDKGVATHANPEFVKKYGLREIEYEQFTEKNVNNRGIITSANAFDDACLYFDKMMKPDKVGTFDTWIIDSGTTLSDLAVNKAIFLLGGKAGFKGIKSETHGNALEYGLVVPKLQDYGAERSLVEQFIAMILASNKHVVFICHEKEKTNDAGITTAVEPLLTGKGSEAVSLMFDEVYRLRAKGQGRALQTEGDAVVKAGSRYGVANDTEWSFDALNKEFERIRTLNAAAAVKSTTSSA